jgi:lipopolysaccharide/colanic/teichoic acid biosynthesis glycosyltransferase
MTDHKLRMDPRVTAVGKFMRKFSIDELPQLWNVVKGEMSLVGPRPIVSHEIPKYGDAYADYCRVRPGLTGLWQVSGRNDTGYTQRVELDRHYVRRWSVRQDLEIIARTLPAVVRSAGAY